MDNNPKIINNSSKSKPKNKPPPIKIAKDKANILQPIINTIKIINNNMIYHTPYLYKFHHIITFLQTETKRLVYDQSCNLKGRMIGSIAIEKTLSNILGIR